jgi:nucleoside-diphosphate-sugar epimerase
MDVSVIAVTGAAGLIGQRLLSELSRGTARLVALDVREPDRRVRALEFHRVDIAGANLVPYLAGVDVVVHLAGVVDPILDVDLMARVNVGGTRNLLRAAAATGVSRFVRVSSATVYGAWPTNPVPLTEESPLRPNPGFSPAVQAAEVERLLAEWRDEHGATVTTLRAAPVVGPGAARLPSRLVLGRPPLRVLGAAPPVQVVHVDDVVAALTLAVTADLPGAYNVAADGWLAPDETRALLPRRRVPALPAEVLERALRRAWNLGLGDVPPGVVPYLVHPWVVANQRLRSAGWAPRHDNASAITDGLRSLTDANRGRARRAAVTGAVAAGMIVAHRHRSASTNRSSSSSVL